MPPFDSLSVLLAHADETTKLAVQHTLEGLGCSVLAACDTASELIQKARELQPELIISGVELPDRDGVSALVELSETHEIPAIIVTHKRSLDIVQRALEDHVMAYMMEPLNHDEMEPTIYLVMRRFEEFNHLQEEVRDLKLALSERKVIERAKGVLMAKHTESEDQAYRRLRRMATDSRIKMLDAARQVLAPHETASV
ncbi:ANTAR domain-containing response regulator [Planctomicrobium piriforme]|uniref:Response regulator NasT n=1 Tax=Planctomicrobium piriforme TaxID=1576369 RepID=A0A1I3L444_9PLAN|nr:ANTAR domain-containing protein [Planctomicrobium piriforme]SFI79473.1 response regulator NasT [Planctomicrobium piriforme]